jgi:hypothetical protein
MLCVRRSRPTCSRSPIEAVERLLEAQGELRAFRTLQKQAAQQGRGTDRLLAVL